MSRAGQQIDPFTRPPPNVEPCWLRQPPLDYTEVPEQQLHPSDNPKDLKLRGFTIECVIFDDRLSRLHRATEAVEGDWRTVTVRAVEPA